MFVLDAHPAILTEADYFTRAFAMHDITQVHNAEILGVDPTTKSLNTTIGKLAGLQPDPSPVTNSACYATITMTQASWLTAVFQYNPAVAAMAATAAGSGASTGWDASNFKDMNTWFNALMADSFA